MSSICVQPPSCSIHNQALSVFPKETSRIPTKTNLVLNTKTDGSLGKGTADSVASPNGKRLDYNEHHGVKTITESMERDACSHVDPH